MNWKTIFKIQGFLLIILSIMMLFPLCFSLCYKGNDSFSIFISFIITLFTGIIFIIIFPFSPNFRTRDGYIIVTLGWLFASIFGSLPYYFHGSFGGFINCFFESMSGFTTTGASILVDIESIPKGLLFWRSLTHWIGGMGIILLTIAILPAFGINFGKLYNAEVPGPIKDRLTPRIRDTAIILWLIYGGLTVIQTILLMIGGMDLFNALCHTFGTLATGGFSTLNKSIGGFNSLYIEIIIIIFMILAGTNFTLHYYLIKGKLNEIFVDRELRFYLFILLISTLLITLNLYFSNYQNEELIKYPELKNYKNNIFLALRAAAFQTVSITTTTGFCTANFDCWPPFSKILLVLLMFFGGCSGSTGGGIKQVRIMIVLRSIFKEIKKLIYPKAYLNTKIGDEVIPDNVVNNIFAFFILFILLFAGILLFLTSQGYDIITSLSASAATLGNIGPGLARVGAIENYNFFNPVSKLVLTFSMLLGRLEIYSVLIFFYSLFYRD